MIALPFSEGARGEAVADLQRRLLALNVGSPIDDPMGVFGPATTVAVRSFQQRYGLVVDGVCSDLTWTVLVEAGYCLGDRQLYLRSPMMRGDDIAALQACLGSLGFDAGRADGIFGPLTASAVAEFQRNAGLMSDGICGPDTYAALERLGPERTAALMVNQVRERERLRTAPPGLDGRRVMLGHQGGAAPLTSAIQRQLRDVGAHVLTFSHPDGPTQARLANSADGDVFIELQVTPGPSHRLAYFRGVRFWSQPGHALAQHTGQELEPILGLQPEILGMRLPLLRETRMPAIVVELGPASRVVTHNEQIATAIARALVSWATEPVSLPLVQRP